MRARFTDRRDRRRGAGHCRRRGTERAEHAVAGGRAGHRTDDGLQLRARQGRPRGARRRRGGRRGDGCRNRPTIGSSDVYAIADAMWRGIRAHPAAIPLGADPPYVVGDGFRRRRRPDRRARTGRTDRPRPARRIPRRAGLRRRRRAGRTGRAVHPRRDAAGETAARIGSVAGADVSATSRRCLGVAMQTSVEEDFDTGLRMLLDGIADRGRSRQRR